MNIVMIGQNDPAGMMIAFRNALHRLSDHQVRVISMRTVYQMDYEHDIELPRIANDDYSEVEQVLKDADIFHFHMLADEDYQLGPLQIKDYAAGKKFLHHHHGTYDHQCFLGKAAEYNRKYRRENRRAIVSTPDLLHLLPTANWQPNLVPLENELFQPFYKHLNKRPVKLVQAPTRKWHKHTQEFIETCERLQRRYRDIECHILEGKSYSECLRFKKECHISFDHMNGWFGIASLESLAQGVPTVAGLDDWNIKHIKDFTGVETLPWIVARDEIDLESRLVELIEDDDGRLAIGKASRAFMEQHWSESDAISVLLETYRTL